MSDFAAGLVIFVCFVLAPVLSMVSVPARYMVAQACLNGAVTELALCEKRSEAYSRFSTQRAWQNMLAKFGVTVTNPRLSFIAVGKSSSDMMSFNNAGAQIPPDWLPNGNKKCIYALSMTAPISVPVLGLSKPLTFNLQGRSHWENISRDPQTGEYYIQE